MHSKNIFPPKHETKNPTIYQCHEVCLFLLCKYLILTFNFLGTGNVVLNIPPASLLKTLFSIVCLTN